MTAERGIHLPFKIAGAGPVQARGHLTALGHERRFPHVRSMSASSLEADILHFSRHIAEEPEEICLSIRSVASYELNSPVMACLKTCLERNRTISFQSSLSG